MRLTTLVAVAIAALAIPATAQLKVVATQPDLADVARYIGGGHVSVQSLTKGTEDLHLVRPRPSLLVRLRRADVFLQLGLDAEHAWVPPLMRSARNRKIQPGASGFVNCSAGIKALRVPTARSRGDAVDLHPRGNPHYNLSPDNMRLVAKTIRDALSRNAPEHTADFRRNHLAWEKELDQRIESWRKKLAPHRGANFVEGHDAWIYFAEFFGLTIAARLEEKPGLSPSPRHLANVIRQSRKKKVHLVVARPQYADLARKVAGQIKGKSLVLTLSSTDRGPTRGYFGYMDHVVGQFAQNLEAK